MSTELKDAAIEHGSAISAFGRAIGDLVRSGAAKNLLSATEWLTSSGHSPEELRMAANVILRQADVAETAIMAENVASHEEAVIESLK